jgi:hypothetical protein
VGHIAAQQLLLRAYRLSLLHGTAPRFHRPPGPWNSPTPPGICSPSSRMS